MQIQNFNSNTGKEHLKREREKKKRKNNEKL